MAGMPHDGPLDDPRAIGTVATVARASLGVYMVGSVVLGHTRGDFDPLPFVLGLVVFPGVVLGWQRRRARRNPERLVATGPVGHALTVAVFLVRTAVESLPLTYRVRAGGSPGPGRRRHRRCRRLPPGASSSFRALMVRARRSRPRGAGGDALLLGVGVV